MASLQAKIEAEFDNINLVVAEIPPAEKLPNLSTLELAGVSTLLHNCYGGIENILKQCLLSLQIEIPDGPSWHRDLLELAHQKGVVSEINQSKLAELLAFRHFMRHAYALDLNPERMESLVKSLPATYEAFQKEVNDFCGSR